MAEGAAMDIPSSSGEDPEAAQHVNVEPGADEAVAAAAVPHSAEAAAAFAAAADAAAADPGDASDAASDAPDDELLAACSRGNLHQLLVSRDELHSVVQVQTLLQDEDSVVEGLLVRYKLCGQYRMGRIACLHATQDGRPYVAVLSSEVSAAGGDQLPILQRIPISSVSATSRFSARQWQQTGRREAAELQATLQLDARLEMREAAKAALAKQAALVWYRQHGAKPLAQRRQHIGKLLQRLRDRRSIRLQEQLLACEPQQLQQAAGGPAQQQEFWLSALPQIEAARLQAARKLEQELRMWGSQAPAAAAAAADTEPLDWQQLPQCSTCGTCHPSAWYRVAGQLVCTACFMHNRTHGELPAMTSKRLQKRLRSAVKRILHGLVHPRPSPRERQPQQQPDPIAQRWWLLDQVLHWPAGYHLQGDSAAEAASEAAVLSAMQHCVALHHARPLSSRSPGGALEELLRGQATAECIMRLALQMWQGSMGPPAPGCSLADWQPAEEGSRAGPVPTAGQLKQIQLLLGCMSVVSEALWRGPSGAELGPEHMSLCDIILLSRLLPGLLLPLEAKRALLKFNGWRPQVGIEVAHLPATSLAEVHAAQLLQQSKAANRFIVMMYVRPAKEYHRRVRDLVEELENQVGMFILPFEVIWSHAEQQTSVTSSPYVDDSGRMWMRPTPVPLAEYHVPPEQVPIILHTLWLQGVIEGRTSSRTQLLDRLTPTQLTEYKALYCTGRLLSLVQPSLPMQLVQQRGRGDSLVCGRVLEHKHAKPGNAEMIPRAHYWSEATGTPVSAAYPSDRQHAFIFHLHRWRQLLEWLGVSSGVLAGLVTVLPRAQAKRLGLTVEKRGDASERYSITWSTHPDVLLLSTTQLGFSVGNEWLQMVLQAGSHRFAGVAACSAAPLPFAIALALRALRALQDPDGLPGEPGAAECEDASQGMEAEAEVAPSRITALELLRQEDPAAYDDLMARVDAEEAAGPAGAAAEAASDMTPDVELAGGAEPASQAQPAAEAELTEGLLPQVQQPADAAPLAAAEPVDSTTAAAATAAVEAELDAAVAELLHLL